MKRKSTRHIFIALSLLAFGQMLWWAYLIMSQQSLIAEFLNTEDALAKARTYHLMIFAEGFFFFGVLSFGIWMAYKSLYKELQLQRSQSDFLGAITHELKTPLTNVRLCLDTLERSNLSEDVREKYLTRAQESVDKLIEEVETILTISNKNVIPREKQKFDLHQLIKSVCDETPTGTQLTLRFSNPLFVMAPYHESRLILKNLIDNAIKYSRSEQGEANIIIETFVEKSHIVARISDNGIGLTSDEVMQAFEPFYRGSHGRKMDPTGTGLGLSLVKRLADSFDIQISLTSEGRGQGTTASIIWPVEKLS